MSKFVKYDEKSYELAVKNPHTAIRAVRLVTNTDK
jgi:hypothetical protein